MLSDGSVFTCEEKLDAVYRVIVHNASKISEWMHSWVRVVEKLHQEVILGLNWLQSIKP